SATWTTVPLVRHSRASLVQSGRLFSGPVYADVMIAACRPSPTPTVPVQALTRPERKMAQLSDLLGGHDDIRRAGNSRIVLMPPSDGANVRANQSLMAGEGITAPPRDLPDSARHGLRGKRQPRAPRTNSEGNAGRGRREARTRNRAQVLRKAGI